MLIPTILSGGAGTRLWPVSRSAYPKPFIRMADGQSLLYKTLDRALRVADGGPVITVTGRDYYFLTRDEYARHPQARLDTLPFLLEPAGRNTAPAILLAALHVREMHGDDATLLVLPADHLVGDTEAFAADVAHAAALAADGWLTTFGIRPDRPETGFGYIRAGEPLAGGGRQVAAFVEKPDAATAAGYLAAGDYLWNSGMFCLRAGSLLDAATEACPEVLAAAKRCNATARGDGVREFDREAFMAQPDISFDYAVMERAARAAVVPATFDWNDIGSWKALSELGDVDAVDADGNRVQGAAILVDSRRCFVQSQTRVVAAVGVDNLVIVDTGDAVLVAERERAQDVKRVVEQLRADNHQAATFHQTVHRPWGSFTVLEDRDDCKVKRLTVKAGGILSLQRHQRRSEHWTVVDGAATVRIGEDEFTLERNQSAYIPMNTLHRLENRGETDIHLIEVQCGDYFGEDDIERLEDVYGRVEAALRVS
ncbi:MAG TPA: mannose-1-phosphate guanylyltransferase/mannose-6-phosphate isomerase [Rhodanobacteraceae bacterium]|nr:mannose-1-phosphate guanylyltransferase/mannose-6-phosphate isomerase [Rhodanobacteraceae bacterium]